MTGDRYLTPIPMAVEERSVRFSTLELAFVPASAVRRMERYVDVTVSRGDGLHVIRSGVSVV